MEIFIVPGNNIKNKEWGELLKEYIAKKESTTNVFLHKYAHWEKGEEMIDIEKEIERFSEKISKKKNFVVVGKSVGTMVCVEAIKRTKEVPQKTLLMGIPVTWAKENNFNIEDIFSNLFGQVVVLQNKEDPITSAKEAKIFLKEVGALKDIYFKEVPGENHDYNDFKLIFKIINSVTKK